MRKLRVAVIAFFTVSALMITVAFSANYKQRSGTRRIAATVTSRQVIRVSRSRPMGRYAASSFKKTTPPPLGPGPTASAPSSYEPSPANLPHGRGHRGVYKYYPAAPATATSSAFLRVPTIEEEFLRRIAAKHSEGKVRVQAAKAGSAKDFDPNRDQETLVLDGSGTNQAPAGLSGGGAHNRDQGGRPSGPKVKKNK